MKVNVEFVDSQTEEAFHMKIRYLDKNMKSIIHLLENKDRAIFGIKEGTMFRIRLDDVFYFEVIDKCIFMYVKDDVYKIKDKLYQIEKRYAALGFVRASKSTIVSIDKVKIIYPMFKGRFEVGLNNGKRIGISRSYITEFKQQIGLNDI